jgi:Arc/MetJ-type ribon-helix-helix transcriptional regulator
MMNKRMVSVYLPIDQIEWLAQKRSEGYVAAFLVRKALREMQEREKAGKHGN